MKIYGGMLLTMAALVALTGCSASSAEPPIDQPASAPTVASSSPAPVAKAKAQAVETVNPNEQIEKQFTEFALMRAAVHSVSKKPTEKAIVTALYAFCEDGKLFKLAKETAYNKNMDKSAKRSYCDYLAK